jgi:hypothetical protein
MDIIFLPLKDCLFTPHACLAAQSHENRDGGL